MNNMVKKLVVFSALLLVAAACTVAFQKGLSVREVIELDSGVVAAKTSRHTVADRISAIEAKKPKLKGIAASAGGKLRILVFKNERFVEVHAPGWKAPHIYPMTAFSGTLGPKLREGDGQIPEGIYGIGYLNPNSSYYLSLKVTYPNFSPRPTGPSRRNSSGCNKSQEIAVCVHIAHFAANYLFATAKYCITKKGCLLI